MANAIGSLFVELGINTASFGEGLKKSGADVKSFGDGVKKAGESTGYSMMEARHGVMLLGEELGVHIPRAVSTLIASIGPVGSIMAAAFPILGALALIGVVGKVIEHFDKAKEAAQAFAEKELDASTKAAILTQSLELENLKLDDQIAKLKGGTKNTLQEELIETNIAALKLAEGLNKDIEASQKAAISIGFWANVKLSMENTARQLGLLEGRNAVDIGKVNQALADAVVSTNKFNAAQAELNSQPTAARARELVQAIKDIQGALTRDIDALTTYGGDTETVNAKVRAFTTTVTSARDAIKNFNLEKEKSTKEAALKKAETPLTAIDKEQGEIIMAQMKELARQTQLQIEYDNLMAGGMRQMDSDLTKLAFDMKAYDKELAIAAEINQKTGGTLKQYAADVEMVNDLIKKGIVTQQDADVWLKQTGRDLGVLKDESKKASDEMAKGFEKVAQTFASDFAKALTGGKNAMADFVKSFEDQMLKMLLSKAMDDLLKKLGDFIGITSGAGSSSAGGGGGGGLGGLLNFFGGLFGGGKAGGGPVAPGVAYLVGEEGQEMFVPGTAGTIVPNSGTIPSSPMHANVNIHVHGASDPDTFRKAAPQIMADAYRHLQIAHAHAGRG